MLILHFDFARAPIRRGVAEPIGQRGTQNAFVFGEAIGVVGSQLGQGKRTGFWLMKDRTRLHVPICKYLDQPDTPITEDQANANMGVPRLQDTSPVQIFGGFPSIIL